MNKQMSKEEIIELLKEVTYFSVNVDDYNIGESRNFYFDSNDSIYEDMINNIDDVTFFVDYVAVIRDEFAYNHSSTLDEIFSVINNINLDAVDGYTEIQDSIDEYNNNGDEEEPLDNLEDLTLEEVKEKYSTFYSSVIEVLDDLTNDDVDMYNDGSVLFDCSYIEEKINDATWESLAYWTNYFSPSYMDTDVANRVGLTPFEYDDTSYLSLGGCGMDLSPKLDAYVALTFKRIPKDSNFFRDSDYFKYVVGNKVYEEIIKKCKLEKQKYTITFEA